MEKNALLRARPATTPVPAGFASYQIMLILLFPKGFFFGFGSGHAVDSAPLRQ